MFDLPQDLFSHSGGFGPAPRPRLPAPYSASPFDRFVPEDRSALATPETLRSPFVRRWLGFPNVNPVPETKAQTGLPDDGVTDEPDRYEVFAGWQVPGAWDLKDLGRAALDNAAKAGSRGKNPSAGPTIAAAAGVDAHRPEGGRGAAAQVRAAKTIRAQATNTLPARRKKPAGSKTAGKRAGSLGASAPAPAPASTIPAKGRALGEPEDMVNGPAASLPAALWRAIGSRLLDAREEIKRSSIEGERRHGDDAPSHDAGVVATARTVDAGLPGNTERATANSALVAGAKYRQSREVRAPETARARTAASLRERYRTFLREAAHARDKAAQAHDDGDDPAASRHSQDAERFREAARSVLADARNTGVDPQQLEGEESKPESGNPDAATAGKGNPAGIGGADPANDPAGSGTGTETSGTADRNDGDESAGRQQSIERQRAEKFTEIERQLEVRNPQALFIAVAEVRTALKQAGSDPAARNAALAAFDSRLKAIGAGIAAAEALKPIVRGRGFASGTAAAEDVVFRALTGSTPIAAAERDRRERRNRALEAERQARAAAAKARLEAQQAEATKQFAAHAAALKDPSGRQEALRRGFAIAREQGAMPMQLAVWLEQRLTEPASGWVPADYKGDGRPGLTVAAADEVERLRREHPEMWARLPVSVRRKAAAVRAVRAGADFEPPAYGEFLPDDRARAILMEADRALSEIAGERHWKATRQAVREGFDLLTDLAPITGEIKAIVEAHDFLHQAEAAEQAGDADKAAKLRGLAGLSIASILPWARAFKIGKAVARIVRVSRKLKAEADPVLARLEARIGKDADDIFSKPGRTVTSGKHPDLHLFSGDEPFSATTREFERRFVASPDWEEYRALTRGRVELGDRYKGLEIGRDLDGSALRIGDVPVFERDGKAFARGLDGVERKIGRTPKEGKGLPVRNSPNLEKDVIHSDSRDGGRLVTIVVRDRNSGKETFRESVYYNRYGLPEFEAKASFWLPPEKMALPSEHQRRWVQNRLREMAQDRKGRRELGEMGFTAQQIESLRVSGYSDDLGVRIHHDYQLGRMILVDAETHARFAHVGGGSFWGTKRKLLPGEVK